MGTVRRLLAVGDRLVTLLPPTHMALHPPDTGALDPTALLRRTHMPHPLTVGARGHTALLHHMGTVPRLPTIMATMVLHKDTVTALLLVTGLLLVTVRTPVCLYQSKPIYAMDYIKY